MHYALLVMHHVQHGIDYPQGYCSLNAVYVYVSSLPTVYISLERFFKQQRMSYQADRVSTSIINSQMSYDMGWG